MILLSVIVRRNVILPSVVVRRNVILPSVAVRRNVILLAVVVRRIVILLSVVVRRNVNAEMCSLFTVSDFTAVTVNRVVSRTTVFHLFALCDLVP